MNKSPDKKNNRILIVDDNRAIHDDFRKILAPSTAAAMDAAEAELFGKPTGEVRLTRYEIDSAYQGQEGVLLVKKAVDEGRPYAMAFVDIRMPPGIDGVETTQKIWAIDPDLQIVICTAYADYSWEEMFEKVGNRDGLLILKKPFDTVEALQLTQALTEKWWLQQQAMLKMGELESRVVERTSELQWKTAFLEALMESSIDGLLVIDNEGKKVMQNQRTVEMMKIPPEFAAEINDERQLQFVVNSTKDPAQFVEKVRYLYSHPNERSRDEIEFKDGMVLDRYSAPVVAKDGKHYGRIWAFRDMTERKRAETALRESEAMLRESQTIANLGTYALDVASGTWSSSELLDRVFEIGPTFDRSVAGWANLIHPDDRAMMMDHFQKEVLEQHLPFNKEYRIVRHDDRAERWVHGLGKLEFDDQGRAVKMIGTVQDITERKQAENALRESDEKFHQLADNITDVFWIRSPDLSEVHYISPAFEKIWGRSVKSLLANPHLWADFILPEDRERVLGEFAALTGEKRSLDIEYRITRPDGEIRWVHVRGFQVRDASDKLIRHTGIVTDITTRKQLESQLFQSQKMETVGKLAGGIAHEFNSILTAIIGQSELLLGDLPAGSPLIESATEINKAAGRAATLTRQLLAYGRRQFLQPEALDLNRIITSMDGIFHNLMVGDVKMHIIPAAGLHAVRADAGQIEQVIMNLVINARDAMPNGGMLTLETANVSFDQDSIGRYPELKPGNYVMLAITDTGTGMTPEVKARAFEPFFTTKDVGQGTGLGLSTCYGIIKQSGGHISVYSETGRGTTFKIYLPQVEQNAEVPSKRVDGSNLPGGTETILLVEDDPALREMAATLLSRLGYKVLSASNGIEALSLKQQRETGHIDLLFTDVVMPHMSGKELADRVRALYPNTKILFTSAYTENAIVHQGALGRGEAMLQKPFTPSALAHKLREALDQPDPLKPDHVVDTTGFTKPSGGGRKTIGH